MAVTLGGTRGNREKVDIDGVVVVNSGVGLFLDVVVVIASDLEEVPCELDVGGVRAKDEEEAKPGTNAESEPSARDVFCFGGGPRAKAASARAARSAPIATLAEVGCPGTCMPKQSYS